MIKKLNLSTLNPRVNVPIKRELYDFFFDGVFCGERGVAVSLFNQFLDKLRARAIERGVQPHWDVEYHKIIQDILDEL